MKIRFGNSDDLQFIITADEETRILEKRPDLILNSEDIRSIEDEIKKKELLVAEEDNCTIGFISFKTDFQITGLPGKVFWIDLVYVKKSHRGKGIGKRLYKEAIKIAKKKGYTKIYAEIYESNDTSKLIHKRMGFNPSVTIYEKAI